MDKDAVETWPSSIRAINQLPENEKRAIYRCLIPQWLYDFLEISPVTLRSLNNDDEVVSFRCPVGSRAMELFVWQRLTDLDPVFYINLADTFNNQLIVLLVVVNDPESRRFNIDVDLDGNPTQFGTTSRNIPAEKEAMQAGLAPGQVREGLRGFRRSLPIFEEFVSTMGQDIFFIEPLAYHNAIVFERYGFNYLSGHKEMQWVNKEFQPGGELHHKLVDGHPFRSLDAWQTIRGRSWAIHDGILGYPFTGFQMYKRIGIDSEVNSFPDAKW